MKKILALLTVAIMLFSFAACDIIIVDDGDDVLDSLNKSTPEATAVATPDPTPEPTPEPTPALSFKAKEYVNGKLSMMIPENFTISDDSGSTVLIYNDQYPTYTDNITVIVIDTKDNVSYYTADKFKEMHKDTYDSFEIVNHKQTKLNNIDVAFCEMDAIYNGVSLTQKQYLVFYSDATAIVTFTEVSGQYDSIFNEIISTITEAK